MTSGSKVRDTLVTVWWGREGTETSGSKVRDSLGTVVGRKGTMISGSKVRVGGLTHPSILMFITVAV